MVLSVAIRAPGRWSAGGGLLGGLLVVCRGWLGGGDPSAISGGNSAVFNKLLKIFLVVAMVWRLSVFFLCSYWQFRRGWRLFRSPGAGRWWEVSGVAWGCWLLDDQGMGGVAEKGAVLLRMGGRVLPHILLTPPWTLGVAENRPGGFLQSGPEII